MLRWRLLGAFAMIVPLLGLIWLDDQFNAGRPGIWLGLMALIVGLLAAQEVNRLIARAGIPVSAVANVIGVLLVIGASLMPLAAGGDLATRLPGQSGWTLAGLILALGWLFSVELYRYRVPGESIARLAGGSLVILYVGGLLSCLIQVRLIPPGRLGLVALVGTILIVKLSDTGAFFVGKSCGRRHFTPISPKKTIEGVLGGVAFAMLAAWLVRDLLLSRLVPEYSPGSRWVYLIYGACLAVAGLLGDLSESLLKRDVRQKDSSQWMRGLGGILDVLDSLLATAPVSLLWWTSGGL